MSLQTTFQTVAPPPLPLLASSPAAGLGSMPKLQGPIAGPAPEKPVNLDVISQANAGRQDGAAKINAQATQQIKDITKAQNAAAAPQTGGGGLPTIGAALLAAAMPGAATAITVAGVVAEAGVSLFPSYVSRGAGAARDKKAKNEETSVFQASAPPAMPQVNRTVDADAFARAAERMGQGRAGIGFTPKGPSAISNTSASNSDFLVGETLRGYSTALRDLKTAQLDSARILKIEVPQLNASIAERKVEGLQVNNAEIANRAPAMRLNGDKVFAYGV